MEVILERYEEQLKTSYGFKGDHSNVMIVYLLKKLILLKDRITELELKYEVV